jgi:GTP-binding protein
VGSAEENRFTVADIPGLVEGAHAGKGLGHDFLRHIERCALLLFVIDAAGTEGRHPAEDYRLLRKELREYDPGLARRPFLVVANKADLPESADHLAPLRQAARKTVLQISAKTGQGIPELIAALRESLPA